MKSSDHLVLVLNIELIRMKTRVMVETKTDIGAYDVRVKVGRQSFNIGLRLLFLERLACSVGSCVVSGNLEFRRVLSIPRIYKNGSLCLTYKVWCILNTWESGILVHAKERMPM